MTARSGIYGKSVATRLNSHDNNLAQNTVAIRHSTLEAVRDQTKTVDLKHVNHVLLQPHWRKHDDPLWSIAIPDRSQFDRSAAK